MYVKIFNVWAFQIVTIRNVAAALARSKAVRSSVLLAFITMLYTI